LEVKGVGGNTDQGISAVCGKWERSSHILICERTKIFAIRIISSRNEECVRKFAYI
jgi:hypothetical protein